MPKRIIAPDNQPIDFPDEMSDQDIQGAMQKLTLKHPEWGGVPGVKPPASSQSGWDEAQGEMGPVRPLATDTPSVSGNPKVRGNFSYGQGMEESSLGALYDNAKTLGQGVVGAGKQALKDVGGVMGGEGGDTSMLTGKIGYTPDQAKTATTTDVSNFNKTMTPTNTPQKVGAGIEQAAEYLAPGFGEEGAADALASKGIPRVLGKALYGGATTAGVEAAHGGNASDITKAGLLGAAFPVVAAPAEAIAKYVRNEEPAKLWQSVMNAMPKEFRFGRNPAQGVVNEGIVANSLEDALDKVSSRYSQRAREVEDMLSRYPNADIDLNRAILDPIHQGMANSRAFGEELYNKLDKLKSRLSEQWGISTPPPPAGATRSVGRSQFIPVGTINLRNFTPTEANSIKQVVGDWAKWTGLPQNSVEKGYQQVLRSIYGKINDAIDAAVPSTKLLNNHVGELMSAKHALEVAVQKGEAAKSVIPTMLSRAIGRGATGAGIGGVYGAAKDKKHVVRDAALGAIIESLRPLGESTSKEALNSPAFLTRLAQLFRKTPSTGTMSNAVKGAILGTEDANRQYGNDGTGQQQ